MCSVDSTSPTAGWSYDTAHQLLVHCQGPREVRGRALPHAEGAGLLKMPSSGLPVGERRGMVVRSNRRPCHLSSMGQVDSVCTLVIPVTPSPSGCCSHAGAGRCAASWQRSAEAAVVSPSPAQGLAQILEPAQGHLLCVPRPMSSAPSREGGRWAPSLLIPFHYPLPPPVLVAPKGGVLPCSPRPTSHSPGKPPPGRLSTSLLFFCAQDSPWGSRKRGEMS